MADINAIRDILDNYLLLDKSVTLQFPSRKILDDFRSTLHTYKRRYNATLDSLGEDDVCAGKSIIFKILSIVGEYPVTVKIYLGPKVRQAAQFQILNVEDNFETIGEPTSE